MESAKKISFLEIPDEVCQYITDIKDETQFMFDNRVSCIVFKTNMSKELYEISEKLRLEDLKTCIVVDSEIIPYGGIHFDYIKTSDCLYMNISEGTSIRYTDISKFLIKYKSQLDPMAEYYFEMFDELKKLNV